MSGIGHDGGYGRQKTAGAGATDRRTARTRALLRQALSTLILERDYEAITIKDICASADVGRSTFYDHFAGKDDLKRSCFDGLRRQLADLQARAPAAHRDVADQRLGFSRAMFDHAREHIGHYRAQIGGRGGAVALDGIRQVLSDAVRAELAATGDGTDTDAIPRELVVRYLVGAFMAVMTWWLDAGAKLPPERMDAMYRRLATEGLAALRT